MSKRDNQGLRHALAQFATGVTIVTTAGPAGEPIGVTANSFNSISLDPPLVLWSLSAAALSRQSFETAGHFCVHVLTSSQEDLSQKFASRGVDKFGGLKWVQGLGSVPMFEEFVARFQCRLTHQYPIGDHLVFVGEVLHFDKSDKRPLVFHGGRYALAERRKMEKLARELSEATPSGEERRKGRESKR
jgi:3-hydroxy-9,10-secoandrosta-1,3,5(10)-triene-9,17-dione monooxygenase reductase component